MKDFTFREFVYAEVPEEYTYSDMEIANLYFHNPGLTVREIATTTGKSIGEMYRLLRSYGSPNRRRTDQSNVIALADSGMAINTIADFTGFTSRHVRNILKKNA